MIIALAAAALLGTAEELAAEGAAAYPDAPTIQVEQVMQRSDVLLLDARNTDEMAVSMIAGARPADALPDQIGNRVVVVYCTIGVRSGALTSALRKRGIDAYNLYGGVLLWAAYGGIFVDRAGQPTRKVHVYGKRWSRLPEHFEPVY